MERAKKFINKYFTVASKVLLCLFLIAILIQIIASFSADFADRVSEGIGYTLRLGLAKLFGFLPFSLAELLIILLPFFLTVIIAITVKLSSDKERYFRFLITVISVLTLFYTLYVFTLGVGYKTKSVQDKMELPDAEVNAENLHYAFLKLKEGCERELENIKFSENGSSVSPLDIYSLSEELCLSYDTLAEEYEGLGIKNFTSSVKPVILSRGMTAIEITGIYSYFTGEANVNVHFPDYTIPFTAAHELAHQRGIARENEANFIAFMVCIRSSDSYIRYSGYLNMLEYVASALSKADKELCASAVKLLDPRIKKEISEYTKFYKENKNELLGKISGFLNDNYLKAQGTEGIVSYSMVTRLCVAYYSN